MSLNMFFKNRHKKHLLNRIHLLKVDAARLNSSAESLKQSIDETSAYLKKQSSTMNTDAKIHLNRNFSKAKELLQKSEENYATLHQMYLNTLDEIAHLEEELNNL